MAVAFLKTTIQIRSHLTGLFNEYIFLNKTIIQLPRPKPHHRGSQEVQLCIL